MHTLVRQPTFLPALFAAAGVVFAMAGLFGSQSPTPGVDVLVHGTYLVVGHIHLLEIGALVCWLYAGLYYMSARILHLTLNMPLSLMQFAITALALIGLGNLHYLGLGHEGHTVDKPLIGLLAVNAFSLLLVSSFVLFGLILLASMIKLHRRSA